MRMTPTYVLTDPEEVKRLIRDNPWVTMVSTTSAGIVASHYPVVLEETAEGISMLSHVGRPDEQLHELGQHEMLLIVQGPHGYISPGWYANSDFIPTWNHVTAHLYGIPELLGDEENFAVLHDLVHHFEQRMPQPVSLDIDEHAARRIARGTVGLRLRVTRFDPITPALKNKSPEVFDRIVEALAGDGPYSSAALAAEMLRVRDAAALEPSEDEQTEDDVAEDDAAS